jgi:hypothetical protein
MTPAEIDAFCSRIPWLVRINDGESACWTYENPETSVTFTLRHDDAGLTCEIPYLRPAFFAIEAMGVVATLCTDLGLTAFESAPGSKASSGSAEWIASWQRGNRLAVQAAHALGALPSRWRRDSADAWWRYARDKARLQESLDEGGVFVPRVFLFVDTQRCSMVRTAMTWSDCIATLFPPADLVMVLDKSNEPTASGRDTRLRGLAERDEVVNALSDLVERVETAVGEVPYLPADRCALARARFRALRVDSPPDPATFRGVSASACIDDEDVRDALSVS